MALPRLFKQGRSEQSWSVVRDELRNWYTTPLGKRLFSSQQEIIAQLLPRCYGQHLMLSGVTAERFSLGSSVVQYNALVSPFDDQLEECRHILGVTPIQAQLSHLPFDSDCIDVALLHHSLDVEHNVHAALRELARVIAPGGTIMVMGFNPWSLWGGMSWVRRWVLRRAPWSCRFMSPYNLSDWLKLLDFEVEGCEYALYLPPINGEPILNWLSAIKLNLGQAVNTLGASYILVAKKRHTLLTPLKPVWRRPQLVPLPL